MLISFKDAPISLLCELWQSMYPVRYHVDDEIIRINTVACSVFDWGASCISVFDDAVNGFLAIKRSANPTLYRGPGYDQAHVSAIAFIEPEVGVDMMAHAKKILTLRGVDQLVFGQDARHFFPGCPIDIARVRDFLVVEGFESGSEVMDLERDLANYVSPTDTDASIQAADMDVAVVTPAMMDALRDFLKQEFNGRWRHDVLSKIEAEGRSDFVDVLLSDGKVEGFALTQDNSHTLPIAGAVWRTSLGADWSTLGPIGVSKAVRGKGLGDALLSKSLLRLKAAGQRRCLIDWTTSDAWYGKHGFVPTRRYEAMTLKL